MAVTVTHSAVVVVPDDGTSPVGTDEWNAAHVISGTLDPANGGTGQSSYTTGDMLVASGATTVSKLAAAASGNVLTAQGVGQAPAWGKVALATSVSGTLGVLNGGTGLGTIPANAVPYASASNTLTANASNLSYDGTTFNTQRLSATRTAGSSDTVSGVINVITDPLNAAIAAVEMGYTAVGARRVYFGITGNPVYMNFSNVALVESAPGMSMGLGIYAGLDVAEDGYISVHRNTTDNSLRFNQCSTTAGHQFYSTGATIKTVAGGATLVADINNPTGNTGQIRVYNVGDNTYTNYEGLAINWSSNVAYIQPVAAGTGTVRPLVVVTPGMTVASLPAAASALTGARAFVTDANATTFASIVAGGGANKIPVYCDGTNWRIG